MTRASVVNRSLVALKKQLRVMVRELNQEAARLTARGRYDPASRIVAKAKSAKEFIADVEALRKKWKGQISQSERAEKGARTQVWEYYAVLAKAISELGGEASRLEVQGWLAERAEAVLKPGDLRRKPSGAVVWHHDIVRAKRAMVKEGFLEPGLRWSLSKSGRNLLKTRSEIGSSKS